MSELYNPLVGWQVIKTDENGRIVTDQRRRSRRGGSENVILQRESDGISFGRGDSILVNDQATKTFSVYLVNEIRLNTLNNPVEILAHTYLRWFELKPRNYFEELKPKLCVEGESDEFYRQKFLDDVNKQELYLTPELAELTTQDFIDVANVVNENTWQKLTDKVEDRDFFVRYICEPSAVHFNVIDFENEKKKIVSLDPKSSDDYLKRISISKSNRARLLSHSSGLSSQKAGIDVKRRKRLPAENLEANIIIQDPYRDSKPYENKRLSSVSKHAASASSKLLDTKLESSQKTIIGDSQIGKNKELAQLKLGLDKEGNGEKPKKIENISTNHDHSHNNSTNHMNNTSTTEGNSFNKEAPNAKNNGSKKTDSLFNGGDSREIRERSSSISSFEITSDTMAASPSDTSNNNSSKEENEINKDSSKDTKNKKGTNKINAATNDGNKDTRKYKSSESKSGKLDIVNIMKKSQSNDSSDTKTRKDMDVVKERNEAEINGFNKNNIKLAVQPAERPDVKKKYIALSEKLNSYKKSEEGQIAKLNSITNLQSSSNMNEELSENKLLSSKSFLESTEEQTGSTHKSIQENFFSNNEQISRSISTRSQEFLEISEFALNAISNSQNSLLSITGSHHTGKSFTISSVVNCLNNLQQQNELRSFVSIKIDMKQVSEKENLYSSIWNQLSDERQEEDVAKSSLAYFFQDVPKVKKRSIVLILDNLGNHTNDNTYVKQILKWLGYENSKLLAILIFNKIPKEQISTLLNDRNIHYKNVDFIAYSTENLIDIVKFRYECIHESRFVLDSGKKKLVQRRFDGAYDDDILSSQHSYRVMITDEEIEECCKLIGTFSTDVAMALLICDATVECAYKDESLLTPSIILIHTKHVKQTIENFNVQKEVMKVLNLSSLQKLILLSIFELTLKKRWNDFYYYDTILQNISKILRTKCDNPHISEINNVLFKVNRNDMEEDPMEMLNAVAWKSIFLVLVKEGLMIMEPPDESNHTPNKIVMSTSYGNIEKALFLWA